MPRKKKPATQKPADQVKRFVDWGPETLEISRPLRKQAGPQPNGSFILDCSLPRVPYRPRPGAAEADPRSP